MKTQNRPCHTATWWKTRESVWDLCDSQIQKRVWQGNSTSTRISSGWSTMVELEKYWNDAFLAKTELLMSRTICNREHSERKQSSIRIEAFIPMVHLSCFSCIVTGLLPEKQHQRKETDSCSSTQNHQWRTRIWSWRCTGFQNIEKYTVVSSGLEEIWSRGKNVETSGKLGKRQRKYWCVLLPLSKLSIGIRSQEL